MMRVRTTFTGASGAPYLNVMHFSATTENLASAQAAVNAVRDFWQQFTAVWQTGFAYNVDGAVDQVDEANGQLFGQFGATGATGSGIISGTEILPTMTQGLVRWNTASFVAGHRVRGRTFLPGLTESSSASGVPGGQLVTTNAPAAITGLLGNATVKLNVWSRPRKATPTLPAHAGLAVIATSGQLQPKFAVLRSRRD